MDEDLAIIIDKGSGFIKAGLAGDEAPRAVVPAVLGRPKTDRSHNGIIGDEAVIKASVLSLSRPIEHGIIKNFDDMEKIWNHLFYNELKVDPSSHPILISDVIHNSRQNREKMMSIMFETFNTPGYLVGIETTLDLFSSGRTTGIVLDIGDSLTQVGAWVESKPLKYARAYQNMGGNDVTNYLARLITDNTGEDYTTVMMKNICEMIKERLCYVSADIKKETENPQKYLLPTGDDVKVSRERFEAPELLFNPQLDEYMQNCHEMKSVTDLLTSTIRKCTEEVQSELFQNIVIAGGSTMFDGFPERIYMEMSKHNSDHVIKIDASDERKCATYVGCSIYASFSSFPKLMITREEFDESGASIVHKFYQ